jgi:hypothetical protein
MRKLAPPSSHWERIEGIHISRDDLEFLIELFRRDVGNPSLSDENFAFDSLDEVITQKGSRPKMLELESVDGEDRYRKISVRFEGSNAWLSGSSGTPFHEANAFIKSRCSWTFKALDPGLWFLFIVLLAAAHSLSIAVEQNKAIAHPKFFIYALFGPLVILVAGFFYRHFGFGLNLIRRHEDSFWRRNSEKVRLILIGAIISTVISWLGQKLSP